jgi:hypothetical protein
LYKSFLINDSLKKSSKDNIELELAVLLDLTLLNLTLLDLAPPPEQVFETYKKLEAAIQSFVKQYRYVIAIK